MGVDTHRAEVVSITLEKHPNADLLSIVRVYNFTVVVATESWLGVEKAVYIQPDSIMPDTPQFRYLKETQSIRKKKDEVNLLLQSNQIDVETARQRLEVIEKEIDANIKYLRIAVKKLRGVISMGMLVQCPEGLEIGEDAAEIIGITHYEPPTVEEQDASRRHTGDDVAPAPVMIYAPKYDVESVYKYADCFERGELVYVSEKIHGQNARFVATDNGNDPYVETSPAGFVKTLTNVSIHAGSRTEWKKKEGGSNWWRVLEQNPWIENWLYDNQDMVLYGEIYGWVQELKYGAKAGELKFRAFDILNGTEYLNAMDFIKALPEEHRVPDFGIHPFDFEALQKLADGQTTIRGASHIREGIVVKPVIERQHWKLGRVMVKMVSNAYLEKSAR